MQIVVLNKQTLLDITKFGDEKKHKSLKIKPTWILLTNSAKFLLIFNSEENFYEVICNRVPLILTPCMYLSKIIYIFKNKECESYLSLPVHAKRTFFNLYKGKQLRKVINEKHIVKDHIVIT